MNIHYSVKEWAILWFLYNKNKQYRKIPHSFKEFEREMGYVNNQSGGIRKFLSYLVKERVLIKKQAFVIDNTPRYIIDNDKIDELLKNQLLYKIIISLDYGELKYSDFVIPLPAEI